MQQISYNTPHSLFLITTLPSGWTLMCCSYKLGTDLRGVLYVTITRITFPMCSVFIVIEKH